MQVANFGVRNGIREVAHILLECLVHEFEAAGQKFGMVAGRS